MNKYVLLVLLISLSFISCEVLTGGWSDVKIDSNDSDGSLLNEITQYAVRKLQSRDNSGKILTVEKILSAKKQVVSGLNFEVRVLIGRTNCRNNINVDLSSCFIEKTQECTLLINHVPWLKKTTLTNQQCLAYKTSSLSLLGGVQGLSDGDKEEVLGLLTFIEKFFNTKSNGFYATKVDKLLDATKQLVAGTLFKLKMQLKLNCQHQQHQHQQNQQHCRNKEEITNCSIDILSRPWLSPATIVNNFKCENITAVTNDNHNNNHNVDDNKLYFYSRNQENADIKSLMKMSKVDAFNLFKSKYNKQYDTVEEEKKRFQIFKDNMKLMQFYQSHETADALYGASLFADLTEEEFRDKYLSKEWDLKSKVDDQVGSIPSPLIDSHEDPPLQFDWRDLGAVTPVKNQGMCGSCWAFSVTGNIEGQWFLKKKQLVSLSEQQLVDCDKLDEGCNGGLPSLAYLEIMRMGGLQTEKDYPYQGRDNSCKFNHDHQLVYINSSLNISKDEKEMQVWLFKNGPMSIGINAMFMQFYMGGVSHPWHILCPASLNHGVLIVGYATKKGIIKETPYWIIKNSWGERWGEKGYYLVYRGDGTCGLNQLVSSAVVL